MITRNRRHLASDHEGTREIWPAFTDVMSTMALILFVMVLLAFVKNLLAAKQLDALHTQIALGEQHLGTVKGELARASSDLDAQKTKLANQERTIADSNQKLGELRGQLQSIAVLSVEVLNKLKAAIEAELGPNNSAGAALVTIADNGDVVLNESLVFESGSWAIKPQAKPLLDGLAKALGKLLADDSIRENIDTIVIQGHTDEVGAAAFNWDLSAKRATAVLQYLFGANKPLAESYGRYFSASAYSKFRPINAGSTPDALQQNRRIEISVIPRDANVRKVIDAYMKDVPGPPASP